MSLTSTTLSMSQLNAINILHLGTDSVPEDSVDAYARSFFVRSDLLSDSALLTASSSLSAPAGTNHTYLPLNSLTGTGTNLGTGANYTVTGTLLLNASEPNPSIGTTYDVSLNETAVAVSDTSVLSREISVIGYRFVRFRD